MGVYVKYTEQDKKTGRLSYRRVFPPELRPFIPRRPRQLKRSLGAVSMTVPAAAEKYSKAQADYDRLVEIAKIKLSGNSRPLSEADIPSLVTTYAYRIQRNMADTHFDANDKRRDWFMASAYRFMPYGFWDEATAKERGEELPSTPAKRLRVLLPDLIKRWQRPIADGDRNDIINIEAETAEELLEDANLEADADSDLYFNLCHALLRQDIATASALTKQVTEGILIEPEPPEIVSPVAAVVGKKASPLDSQTMPQLANVLLSSSVDPVGRSTRQSWMTALRFWEEVNPRMPHGDINRRTVSQWLDTLSQRPTNIPKSDIRLPLPKLLEKYKSDLTIPRLAGKTIRQHLGSLSAIWNKAQQRGLIGDQLKPFGNHAVRVKVKAGGNPLTLDEMNAVLSLPVFTKGERPRSGRGEAAYWLPLFLIFTGARPEEVAQLLVSDFTLENGTLVMQYTDEGIHPAGGQRHLKTSRKSTGARQFPVPQYLLDLGLEDYLIWLKERGEAALFPKLTQATKGLYDGWGRWWGRYVREAGVIPEGKRQAREFRHYFPTAARESGVSGEVLSYIMGHSTNTRNTTDRYGSQEPLGRDILRVRFSGLQLSQVKRWSAAMD